MMSAAYDGCVVDLVETPQSEGFAIGPPEETHALDGYTLKDQL